MESPLLSIICLSWNHEKYIEQALTSIINQTYCNFEIIYLDNDSSDSSFKIGANLLKNSTSNYQIKQFETNIGMPKALNYAIKNMCKGAYISMISMDDWLELNNYELKIHYSLQHPEFGIVYSTGNYYLEKLNEKRPILEDQLKEGWIFDDLLKSNFLYMMGAIIKKEVYDTVGLYDEDNSIEDWDFALRASQKYPIGLVRVPSFYYRAHTTNYSSGSYKYYKDCLKVIQKYKGKPNYKIGFDWINKAYMQFMLKNPFRFKNLIYIIKYSKVNRKSALTIIKYIIPFGNYKR